MSFAIEQPIAGAAYAQLGMNLIDLEFRRCDGSRCFVGATHHMVKLLIIVTNVGRLDMSSDDFVDQLSVFPIPVQHAVKFQAFVEFCARQTFAGCELGVELQSRFQH